MQEPRHYLICVPNDATEDDFARDFARRIRNANAEYPDSRWVLTDSAGDKLAQDFLRQIGTDPRNITIYYRSQPPVNPHNYRTYQIENNAARDRFMVSMTTHDIEIGAKFHNIRVKSRRKLYPRRGPSAVKA